MLWLWLTHQGRLAYLFLTKLVEVYRCLAVHEGGYTSAQAAQLLPPVVFIMTDFARSNIGAWQSVRRAYGCCASACAVVLLSCPHTSRCCVVCRSLSTLLSPRS